METPEQTLRGVLQTIENAAKLAGRPRAVRLLAVSKTRTAVEVRAMASAGQRAFGENYVREGAAKAAELAALGAKGGGAIAEAVNPTEYTSHFQKNYQSAPYYVSGSEWKDYEPAYKYGYDTYGQYQGRKFEEVESDLERNWEATKANSRLGWMEAKGAVRDGWHHIERRIPGDFDRDGR